MSQQQDADSGDSEYWLEVSVRTDGEGAEAVAEALRPYAYNDGVVLEQLGDRANPDPDALEAAVAVKIYLPGDQDTPALRRRLEEVLYHLGRLYPIPAPTFRILQEEDWANAWKAHYYPFRVGERIWIKPSWIQADHASGSRETAASEPGDVVLTLDPGMAFGTGLHPTTQMCLQALEQLVQPGMRVLDVGTGSAILTIAAAKLGAGQLLGIDNDDMATKTARANVALNGVEDRVEIRPGTLEIVTETGWDIVVVNILARVIVPLLGKGELFRYVAQDGFLILSGIINEQAATVITAMEANGGRIVRTLTSGDWLAFVAQHEAGAV